MDELVGVDEKRGRLWFTGQSGYHGRLDPATGKELWHYPFPYRTATCASPVVWNDIVNVTAGYGVGGGASPRLRPEA